jgi:hypothetical protein
MVMNLIKRYQKDSAHQFLVEKVRVGWHDPLSEYWKSEPIRDVEFPQFEWDANKIADMTSNVEIRIKLDSTVQVLFVDYNQFPHFTEYEILDWFTDNVLEWSSCEWWIDRRTLGTANVSLKRPTHAERLAGALEICRLLLDTKFHDLWNFSVGTELKGGNEYSYMPLHEYIHPAYIRGI